MNCKTNETNLMAALRAVRDAAAEAAGAADRERLSGRRRKMIVDAILDRRDGDPWDREAWEYVREEAELFEFAGLVRTLDGGRNADIRRELCAYVDRGDYNPAIKEYVNSVDWAVKG